MRFEPGVQAVRAKPRASQPVKTAWLHEDMTKFETAGMMFRDTQAIYGSVAMAIPKGSNTYRMIKLSGRERHDRTGGYAHVKPGRQSVSVRGRHGMVHAVYAARLLAGAAERGSPQDTHHCHSEGLFTPRRVPPGVLNATGYFQETMGYVLEGYIDKICLMWVNGMVIWRETPEVVMKRLLAIGSLLERRLFVAVPETVFFQEEVKWCGKNLLRTDGKPRPRAHPRTECVASTGNRWRAHAVS